MTSDADKQQGRSDGESSGGATPAQISDAWISSWVGLSPCPMPSCSRPWSVPSVIASGRAKA
jgi:hypothetical protein